MLAGIYILSSGSYSIAQENDLLNSGFEEGVNTVWSYNIVNGSDVTVLGNGTDVYAGDSALQLDIHVVGDGGPQVIGVYQDISTLSSGGKYLVSCALKGPVEQEFRFRILGDLKQFQNFTVTSSGWNNYEFLIDNLSPSGDGQYRCAVEFAFTDNSAGTWLIDEFRIEDYFTIPGNLVKVFVSPDGDDANPGTIQSPVKTIGEAFTKLAGDTIFLYEGRYHEESVLLGKSGVEGAPIVITPLPGHHVVFDGTVAVNSTWENHSGNIYKTNFGTELWQLFSGDTLLMPARWPNAFLHDGSVWDRELYWAHGDESLSTNGIEVDDPSGANDLAASGIDATGAMAVMNVGSWKTSAREVLSHSAGSNTFEYDPVTFTYKTKHHYYYLEGTLELLDAPGEWCYDVASGDLYAWIYDDIDPGNSLRGKDQSYALSFTNCNYIQIKGIDFFATTLKFDNCRQAVVEDCNFNYPSSSKRVLMNNAVPDVLIMENSTSTPSNNKLINCTIQNTESHAFYLEGNSNLVENCRLINIDWVVADRPALMNSIYLAGDNNIFRRNTVSNCGASSTIFPGNFPVVEYNRVWSTGHMQSDGSITQVVIGGQPGSIIRNNWFHNTVKSGARFDAPIPPTSWGYGGTMQHNVIWETGSGLMLKGEYHYGFNNTVYGTDNNGIIVLDDSGDAGGANVGTVTRNNISDKLSGHRKDWMAVPGIADHNWNGYVEEETFNSQLLDPYNLDFRPNPDGNLIDAGDFVDGHTILFHGDAPDIGAYEYGDSIYWIAGRKLSKASSPVPSQNGTSNSSIVDLMWLEAYKAKEHDVYFSSDSLQVAEAGINSEIVYLGRHSTNIVSPGILLDGEKYFWRVDVIMEDGSATRGDLWYFTAGVEANIPVDSVVFEIFGREQERIFMLDSAEISINGQILYTDSTGMLKLNLQRGQYEWTVSKTDFETGTASFYSENNLLLRDTLNRSAATVTFQVESASIAVANAEVILGNETSLTDSSGSAVFYPIPVDESFSYSVFSTAYETVEGTVSIHADTIINISIEPLGVNTDMTSNLISVYPNPIVKELFIDQIPASVSKIEVYGIGGSMIFIKNIVSDHERISVDKMKAGSYILKLVSAQGIQIFQSSFIVSSK